MFSKHICSAVLLTVVYSIICQAAPSEKNFTKPIPNSGFKPIQGTGIRSTVLPVTPQSSSRVPVSQSSTSNNSTIVLPPHQRVGRSVFNGTSNISVESDEEERDDLSSETTKPKSPLFRPLGGFRPSHFSSGIKNSSTIAPSTTNNINTSGDNRPIIAIAESQHTKVSPVPSTSSEVTSGIEKRSPVGQEIFATTGSTTGNVTRTHILVAQPPTHH